MEQNLSTIFGLKFNPFIPSIPVEGLHVRAEVEHFLKRLENLTQHGGFALITGDPGAGKSAVLRLLLHRLGALRDLKAGVLTRPHSQPADFYREMGDIFGVKLSPHNRWAGTRVLRERWTEHMHSALHRPVLLIDEAQEMLPGVLGELRMMMSTQLDSNVLLTVVLCGDSRLTDKLRTPELIPVGSRMRVRLVLDPVSPAQLQAHLRHTLECAGQTRLMSQQLQTTLCEHAAGNLRVLMNMAAELLDAAAARDLREIDEKLYLEVFAAPVTDRQKKNPVRRT